MAGKTRNNKSSKENEITIPFDTSSLTAQSIKAVTAIVEYYSQILKCKDEEIKRISDDLSNVSARLSKLEGLSDDSSANDIKDNLIISGNVPEVIADENCSVVVTKLLKSKIDYKIQSTAYCISH